MVTSLLACSKTSYPNPEESVKGFFDALNKADLNSAANYCALSSLDEYKFDDKNEENFAKLVFGKTKCEIVSSHIDGDTSIVKVKLSSVDLSKVYEKMMNDMIEKMADSILKGENISEEKAEEMTMQYLEESISKPDVPVSTKEMDIKLNKDKKKKIWVIQDDTDFTNGIAGNLKDIVEGK